MKALTVVATSRNDDHGGNLLHRMQLFVDGLIAQCNRHNLDAELILVEWNPPDDRPRLSAALRWPKSTGMCDVRIIEVPTAIHNRFQHSAGLPLFQMIAKNVGIRRARGRFVLATNIDIIFSDELMQFIAREPLQPATVYRIDRYDVYGDVPLDLPIDELLVYCRRHVLRVNRQPYSKNLLNGETIRIARTVNPYTFLKTYLQDWQKNRRSKRSLPLMVFRYLNTCYRRLNPILPSRLHTNACGDFTLMDVDSWHALRGYWEWEGYSMHLDTHLLVTANLTGINQWILPDPMRIYHIEHEIGSGFTPEGMGVLQERMQKKGIPMLDFHKVEAWAGQLRKRKTRIDYNDEDWGLANVDLPETPVGSC